jgi:hypothetical protein
MLPQRQSRRILNIPFVLFSLTVFTAVYSHYSVPLSRNFLTRRYSDPMYFLPEECYGSYPRKPYYCKSVPGEGQAKNVYYFIPEVVVPSVPSTLLYPVRRPKPSRRPMRLPSVNTIKRRYHKLWLRLKPKFIYLKNTLAELPPPVKAIPILMTMARTAMMVK